MTLEQLIAQQRGRIAALLAERQPHTDTLTRLRELTAGTAERAERDLTDAEATEARTARDARTQIDAQIAAHQARLDEFEAELRDQQAIEQLSRQVGTVFADAARAHQAGEHRVGGATVTRGERTYRADQDPTGRHFLRDVAAAHFGGYGARENLAAHMREERVERAEYLAGMEQRAAATSAFAGLVVPQYLTDLYGKAAKAGRPLANAMRKLPLPEVGMTVNISRITTATSTAIQTENANLSETNIDDTLLSPAVLTIGGRQTLSRQAVERGVGTDEVTIEDLIRSYGTTLDSTLITQASTGLDAVATSITYDDASPTAAELYPKLLAGVAGAEAALVDQSAGDVFAVMHSRRWYWVQSQLSSTFPLIGQGFNLNVAGVADAESTYGSGFRGVLPSGTPVIVDNNIATNSGAGTEDRIYFVSKNEAFLWEDPNAPLMIRTETGPSMLALGVDIVVYGYAAYTFARQAHSQKIAGTGLIAPAFA